MNEQEQKTKPNIQLTINKSTSTQNNNQLRIQCKNINFHYGTNHALKDLNLNIETNKITALIGPSGCGKSTFIRTLNRMYEHVPNTKIEGEILLDNQNILTPTYDIT